MQYQPYKLMTMSYNDDNLNQTEERKYSGLGISGFAMIFFTFVLIPILTGLVLFNYAIESPGLAACLCLPLIILFILGCVGYLQQEPNVARVMIFFGRYVGTFYKVGFYWVNPLVTRKRISLRIRNMDIQPIKVNDKLGNPVMIGMVLVWRIKDTYKAVFDLDSQSLGVNSISNGAFERFVSIQSDAALREVTGHFAYDDANVRPDGLTLRDGGDEINILLEQKINERLEMAGMEVVEARLNYLAYAPEIAAVMLRRQQATAVIAAREKIVEGAVSMVKMAIESIEKDNIVHFDDAKRAALVSNLLVVLCSDEPAQPVLNTSES